MLRRARRSLKGALHSLPFNGRLSREKPSARPTPLYYTWPRPRCAPQLAPRQRERLPRRVSHATRREHLRLCGRDADTLCRTCGANLMRSRGPDFARLTPPLATSCAHAHSPHSSPAPKRRFPFPVSSSSKNRHRNAPSLAHSLSRSPAHSLVMFARVRAPVSVPARQSVTARPAPRMAPIAPLRNKATVARPQCTPSLHFASCDLGRCRYAASAARFHSGTIVMLSCALHASLRR